MHPHVDRPHATTATLHDYIMYIYIYIYYYYIYIYICTIYIIYI